MKDKIIRKTILIDQLPDFVLQLESQIVPGDVLCLTGEMGAGKTTFVYNMLQALGLAADAGFSSPTFTVLNQYELERFFVNHLDLYRLNRFADFESLDLFSVIEDKSSVSFVEWGDKFSELEPFYTKKIHFSYVAQNDLARHVVLEGFVFADV